MSVPENMHGGSRLFFFGTVAAVALLALFLFWSCLHYFFVTDDFALIEAGRAPLSTGIPHHFTPGAGEQFRPLAQYGYFWLVNDLFGLSPLRWHVANFVLHIIVVAIATDVFRQLLAHRLASAGASIAFGIHSSLFLVFAWVAIAGEIWITLFALVSLSLYLRHLRRGELWSLGGAVAACILALLSKEMAISVPLILLLAQVLFAPGSNRLIGRRIWLRWSAAPFIIVWLGYLLLVRRVQGVPEAGPYAPQIEPGAGWTFLTYLWWTVDIGRFRDFPATWFLALVGAGLIGVTVWAVFRRERVALFGLGWFAIGIGPVLFLPDHMFHYYLYWPLGGIALVFGVLIQRWMSLPASDQLRYAGLALVLIALIAGNFRGVQYQHEHDQTMMQADQGERVLQVLNEEIPDPVDGTTIHFVEPASHVFHLMGYGAAPRLYNPGVQLNVYFDGHIPAPEDPSEPVYRFQWDGHTVVNVNDETASQGNH